MSKEKLLLVGGGAGDVLYLIVEHCPKKAVFFTCHGHPFPAVCLRTSIERPEALDKGCVIMTG